MKYYIEKTLDADFENAVELVKKTLKNEGFGVLSEIYVNKTLKEKLDVDFRDYVILGACNPPLAHEALSAEDKIGTMLPCNVIVQALDNGKSEVAAVDPFASMQAVENEKLKDIAKTVKTKLDNVIKAL
jgi:uncharacterized protein (DUF302 family)